MTSILPDRIMWVVYPFPCWAKAGAHGTPLYNNYILYKALDLSLPVVQLRCSSVRYMRSRSFLINLHTKFILRELSSYTATN